MEEITPLLEVGVEMRKRVTDQLAKIRPAEFTGTEYACNVKDRWSGVGEPGHSTNFFKPTDTYH